MRGDLADQKELSGHMAGLAPDFGIIRSNRGVGGAREIEASIGGLRILRSIAPCVPMGYLEYVATGV